MNILTAENISKSYAHKKALDKFNLDLSSNNILGLLGPNGAGKTTFIRIITQITAPDTGTILFNGKKLTNKDCQKIGYLPEERGLYKKVKVGEQAIYFSRLKGLSRSDARKSLKEWFERFDITAWWNKKVEELSKGMQQKVQFIITVAHHPELIIFDEPFSGFDPINANLLKDEILRLKENGASIIFSTHQMESVETLCDHIVLLNNSKKVLDGQIHTIKNSYKKGVFTIAVPLSTDPSIFKENKNIELLNTDINTPLQQLNLTVKKKIQQSNNDLLKELASLAEIRAFNEQVPSMNEIFIQTVNQQNTPRNE